MENIGFEEPSVSSRVLLVVDDEPYVLAICQRALRDAYQVFTAASATEALQKLGGTTVDLVLTDLQIPDMNGNLLAAAIREDHPAVSVAMMTGEAPHSILRHEALANGHSLLEKPFTLDQLRAFVAAHMPGSSQPPATSCEQTTAARPGPEAL